MWNRVEEFDDVDDRLTPDILEQLAVLHRGDHFGEEALISGQPQAATVEAMEDS